MDQHRRWVPAWELLDEGYWAALLADEEEAQLSADLSAGRPAVRPSAVAPNAPPAPAGIAWWDAARAVMDSGQALELPVVGCNRGGVLVAWDGMRGFVPASHLVRSFSTGADEDERQEELRRLIGAQLCLKVLELDRDEGRVVLSERLTHQDEHRRQQVLDDLCPGDVRHGRVTNLCSFGAFVDLDGVEGLAHISELAWGHVEHPRDVLQVGQQIEVYVLNIDRERGRVGLSLKRLQPDPWAAAGERYQPGEMVEGIVTRVVTFGAFVRIEEGLEGLLHVSELEGAGARPTLAEGMALNVRVLSVDARQRRMALGLRPPEARRDEPEGPAVAVHLQQTP